MKQIFILLSIILTFKGLVIAQEIPGGAFASGRNQLDDSKQLDSLGYSEVKSVIRSWKLIDLGIKRKTVYLDTVLGDQQNYNPIYQQSISNSYLGNLGSAYQSNVYMDRPVDDGFIFFNAYRTYLSKPENITYFNTTTPYTRLIYDFGGPKGRSENLLKVLHTQNIKPNWNFGVEYNLISSDGQYQHQKTKLYDFTIHSNYRNRNYEVYFVINTNHINVNENGGLVGDSLLTQTNDAPENIQVNLEETKNSLTNFNFFMNHSYGVGKEREIVNDQDTTYSYALNMVYNMSYENNSWKFVENILNDNFYSSNLYDDNSSFDKVEQSKIKNSLQLVFNENDNKWIRLGARFGILNTISKYNLRRFTNEYSLQQVDEPIHSNEVIANLYSLSGNSLNWKAEGRYGFEGYKQNDFHLSYQLTKWIGEKEKEHGVSVRGVLDSRRPNYLLNEFYGNHQQWNQNLDKITELTAKIEYFNKAHHFKIGAQFNQIHNYTYFDLNAIPQQAGKGISVLTGYIEKNFTLGHFHLNQKIVGQNSSDDYILPLPDLSIYSNNFYQNTFFGGALGLQTGFAVRYNTSFYASDYMPSTGQFFLQREKQLGDYPKIDLYFNFRIKRTRFFVMYEHANASFGSKNYFNSLHYPINPSMLKIGLIWTFYN
ncbi:putative porin [Ancylomarina longa]|uniref:Porin n=1 Tax=Ancylomarina longa TaxID=2487017 RepID=A0A434ATK1_9BACT|nr:putative porin [Ancylomarina longa]RUT77758.1 hypothetical protein DLK05_11880 [Ancylomarina longa]